MRTSAPRCSIGTLAARALDLALPARCPGCGSEGAAICGRCLPQLDARLGLPGGIPIGLPSDVPAPLLQLEWCAPFSGLVRRALHELKYAGEKRLAVPLGDAIARRWARVGAGGDLFVPVPIHAERAKRRGYDQAELIARAAAASLRLPSAAVLERTRATTAQFDLDRSDRATNVRGAFALRGSGGGSSGGSAGVSGGSGVSGGGSGGVSGRSGVSGGWSAGTGPATRVRGRWIVLVDDVVTTGATLAACATALLEAGAIGVSAITVARER